MKRRGLTVIFSKTAIQGILSIEKFVLLNYCILASSVIFHGVLRHPCRKNGYCINVSPELCVRAVVLLLQLAAVRAESTRHSPWFSIDAY